MVKIVRHKSLTVDGLRERLKGLLGTRSPLVKCRHCDGTGQGTIDVALVAGEIGVAASTLYGFTAKGKARLSLEGGLKLLAWLDRLDRDKLDELDDEHEPTDPEAAAQEGARMRQLRATAANAAATAAIEARDRPLQLIQPGGGRHGQA